MRSVRTSTGRAMRQDPNMRRGRQWDIQREVNARIPRGSLDQNHFRALFWSWRSRGCSFEDSLSRAAEHVRQGSPGFSPRWIRSLAGTPELDTPDVQLAQVEDASS